MREQGGPQQASGEGFRMEGKGIERSALFGGDQAPYTRQPRSSPFQFDSPLLERETYSQVASSRASTLLAGRAVLWLNAHTSAVKVGYSSPKLSPTIPTFTDLTKYPFLDHCPEYPKATTVKKMATLRIELACRRIEERNSISWTTRETSCGMKEAPTNTKSRSASIDSSGLCIMQLSQGPT